MITNLRKLLGRLSSKLGFQRDRYLILLAALVGLGTALVAMAFIQSLHWVAGQAEELPRSTLLWLVVAGPALGGLLCGLVVYLVASEAKGHGVPQVLWAIHRMKSRIRPRVAIAKWMGSFLTLSSGGSAGAEGPVVQVGSALGSTIAQKLRLNPQQTATLLGCGAAAAISAVFNAPIAGIFFVLEILLRDFSLRTFTPVVIASVFSAALVQSMLGENEALFAVAADFPEGAFQIIEIPNYLILGGVCGLAAIVFIRTLYYAEDVYERIRIPPILKPVTGGILLGIIGLVFMLMSKENKLPPFFGNGYPVIKDLLNVNYYQGSIELQLAFAVAAIGLLKIIATSLTLGSGGSGGIFAPSLLLGACVGGAFGAVVHVLGLAPDASPAHYALVGMAAVVAATTHAPLTAILIVYEITQSYEIILPLMLAAVISTVVAQLVQRESIYTLHLVRKGVRIGSLSDLTILRRIPVGDVPLADAVTVHPSDSAQRLLDLVNVHAVSDFVVIDDNARYLGMVVGSDLRTAMLEHEAIPLLLVSELERDDLPTVTPDETLDVVLDKFSLHDVYGLAVLDSSGDGRVLGLITRDRLMRRYQKALTED